MGGGRFQVLAAITPVILLVGFMLMVFPMHAIAYQVTLAWDVKNQTQDGFRVYKRMEGQAYDYNDPAWPTDGLDHTQKSCTLTGLSDEATYYFVVRAYAGSNQSGDSNEVTYMAPASSPLTIVNDNRPPAAEAGANQSVNAGDLVVLDASGSSDPDGDNLSYTWIQKGGPPVSLSGPNSAKCSFTAPDPKADSSAIVFELNVTDSRGKTSGDTCIVLVNAVQQRLDDVQGAMDGAPTDNGAPEQPALMGIAYGESDVSLTPLLKTSEFFDPDPDDQHAQTEWRISLSSSIQKIILDRTCEGRQLAEIRVPSLVLDPSTEYSAQVRFFDNHGLPSQWSAPVIFTTGADENDQNQDRIPDSQEIDAATDMNGDMIADADQALVVKSLATYDDQHMVGISVEMNDPSVQMQAAASIDPATLTVANNIRSYPGYEMPYGILGYKIKVDQPGDVIAVKFNLSAALDPLKTQWLRYDGVDRISNCDASTAMEEDGLTVMRYLVDGGDEDADGVANGVIVELSGPSEVDAVDDTLNPNLFNSNDAQPYSGASGGGCFIRTLF